MKRYNKIFAFLLASILMITSCSKSENPDSAATGTLTDNVTNVPITPTEELIESPSMTPESTEKLTNTPYPSATIIPTVTVPTVTQVTTPTMVSSATPIPTPSATPIPTLSITPKPFKPVPTPTMIVDAKQLNSIAMLNYLTYLLQEINDSKNNRVFLEEAYSNILNKLNPEIIDQKTQDYLNRLLFTIEKFRMIEVKRERLKYMYEQNKARALREAMPNPLGLLSAASSFRLDKIAMSVLYMAVDSVTSYNAYNEQLKAAYLQDGWALDDEQAEQVHLSRSAGTAYLWEMVRDYEIPEKKALTEESLQDFVKYSNNSNPDRRIQFFEAYKSEYEYFELYWLELTKAYYEKGRYKDSLDAMEKYEKMRSNLFKENRDYCYAKYIPYAILSAEKYYGELQSNKNIYTEITEKYAGLLDSNANRKDWTSKYFAAQTYIKLYSETNNKAYLEKAFKIVKNSINDSLIEQQRKMNLQYLSDVKEVIVPENADDYEEDSIEDYNKKLKETRVTELPPVYEPLVLNLDLLFSLANELNISASEKESINAILHASEDDLFLSAVLNRKYMFDGYSLNTTGKFEKDTFTVPAIYVSENTSVEVEVHENGETNIYTDWAVSKVERPGESILSFKVIFESEAIDKQKWSKNTTVKVKLKDNSSNTPQINYLYYEAREEYRPIIPNAIVFDQQY